MGNKKESFAFGLAGILFGAVVGYVLAFQIHAPRVRSSGVTGSPSSSMVEQESQGSEEMMDRVTGRIRELQEASTTNPANPRPLIELGELYFQAFMFEKAADYFKQALGIEPGNLDVRTSLGITLIQMDRPEEALEIFEESVAMNPDHWPSWLHLGVAVLTLHHDLEKAEMAFAEVERIHPDLPQLEELRREMEEFRTSHQQGS